MGAILKHCILLRIPGKRSHTDGYYGPKVGFSTQHTRKLWMLGRNGRTMTCLFHQHIIGLRIHTPPSGVLRTRPLEVSLFEEKETSLDH